MLDVLAAFSRRHYWAALSLYIAISLVLGSSILPHLGDRIIGPNAGDNVWFAWELWQFRHAVAAGQDPAHTHLIFGLLPSVQIFIQAIFNQVAGWTLQWVASPLAAYNILVLASFIFSGFTMYVLAADFVQSRTACFAAGFFYDFSTFHFVQASAHLGLLTMQWLPFCAWRTFRFYRNPNWPNAALAGLGIALVPLSETYYLPCFLIPFLVLFVAGKLLTDFSSFTCRRHLYLSGFAGLLALVIAVPPMLGYLRVDVDVRDAANQASAQSTDRTSADLLAFVLPFESNPLIGQFTSPTFASMNAEFVKEEGIYLGWPAIVLGCLAFAFRRSRKRTTAFWAVLGLAGFLMALGPELTIGGRELFPLPFSRMLFGWPLLSTFRVPSRLAILPLFSLSLLSAHTLDALIAGSIGISVRRMQVLTVTGIALAASLVSQVAWSVTLPTFAMPIPALYARMAQDTSGGLVLDLPIQSYSLYQYYQITHGRPMVGGYGPRESTRMLDSIYNVPYLWAFDATASLKLARVIARDVDIYPVRSTLSDILRQNDIRYVVLHLVPEESRVKYGWIRRYLQRSLGRSWGQDRTTHVLAWRITPRIKSVNRPLQMSLGGGWLVGADVVDDHMIRFASQDAQFVMTSRVARSIHLLFRAVSILKAHNMELYDNGQRIRSIHFSAPLLPLNVDVNPLRLHPGKNVIRIHSRNGCARPIDLNPKALDTRCFTFGIQQVSF